MILVDANVMMYAAGADHPNKAPSIAFLSKVASGEINAAINAETLQEILHRYRAIRRWEDGKIVYEMTRQIFATVLTVDAEVLDHSKTLLDKYPRLMARDALHAAVCRLNDLGGLCSFDRDFDQITEVHRLQPPL